MNLSSLCSLVACLLAATASLPAGAAGSDLFCTVESIPVSATCPDACPKPLRMRATEVDGVRHLLWISTPAEPQLRTARSINGGAWTYSTIPLPGNPNALEVHGTLAVVGYGTNVRFLRLADDGWVTEETLPTGHSKPVRSLAIGVLDGVERVVVGSSDATYTGPSGSGAASLYRRDGAWAIETTFDPPSGTPPLNVFGFSVAIDGARVVIGTPSPSFDNPVPLVVHELVEESWVAAATIPRPVWLLDAFGIALSLHGDTLAVHAEGDDGFPGIVQLVQRQAGTWNPLAILQGEGAGQWFGSDLQMIDDGDAIRLAIGVTRVSFLQWPGADGPVLTAGWLYRLEQGVVLAATRLRAPGPDGIDRNARSVSIVPTGEGEFWIALSAPAEMGMSTFRIAERDTPDCDGDGVPDACALIDDPSLDENLDGVPDSCESIPGDLDGNGIIDGADLGLLLGAWGQSGGAADLNGDGTVDGADLGVLLGAWTG